MKYYLPMMILYQNNKEVNRKYSEIIYSNKADADALINAFTRSHKKYDILGYHHVVYINEEN